MIKKYKVAQPNLNFRIHGVQCKTGDIVEFNEDDYIVQVHVACKALVEVVAPKPVIQPKVDTKSKAVETPRK